MAKNSEAQQVIICPSCQSTRLRKRGQRPFKGILSQRYSCKECYTRFYREITDNNEAVSYIKPVETVNRQTKGGWNKTSATTDEARKGNIPEIGLNEDLQGIEVTGVTYLKKDENNVLHWVKTKAKSSSANMLEEFADRLIGRVDPVSVINPPDHTIGGLLTQYTITDLHVGMYSWSQETGADWDLGICYKLITGAVDLALEYSPNSETGLLMQLGDFFHYDGHSAVTPTNGHLLDADGRFQHMLHVGEDIILETIEKMLAKHTFIDVVIAQGNHDLSTSDTLRSLIRRYYSRNDRVNVIGGPNPFYAIKHGKTMIGAHHGHLKRRVALPTHFSQYFSEIWGSTSYRYLHSGHLHCHHEEEKGGATTIQHSTMAAPDAYAAHRFDKTLRSINSITYSDKYGMISRNIIPVEMVA